jgi:sporulation protein YlmC with PRC-barrel domain
MMKKLLLGAAVSALMVSGTLAQAPNASQPSRPAASKLATNGQGAGKADFVMSQKPDQWLASNFKGTDVVGPDNKKIGDVSDILFNKTGKIEAYVVSVGGFLGMGSKNVAITPNSFDVMPGSNGSRDKLKLSLSQDELKQAQNFKPYQMPRPAATTGARPVGSPLSGGLAPNTHR